VPAKLTDKRIGAIYICCNPQIVVARPVDSRDYFPFYMRALVRFVRDARLLVLTIINKREEDKISRAIYQSSPVQSVGAESGCEIKNRKRAASSGRRATTLIDNYHRNGGAERSCVRVAPGRSLSNVISNSVQRRSLQRSTSSSGIGVSTFPRLASPVTLRAIAH